MSAAFSPCSSCPTAFTGGECPRCGLTWFRGANGKMQAGRWRYDPPPVAAPVERPPDFWRNSARLEESIALARRLDPVLAEAVNALCVVWNLLLRELSGQQFATLLIVHTRQEATSRDVATALGVSQQAASNVLRGLTDKNILARSKKGRTAYTVAHLWPMGSIASAAQIVTKGLLPESASARPPLAASEKESK